MKKNRNLTSILLALLVVALLSGCNTGGSEATTDPNLSVTELTLVAENVTDLVQLNQYPNLAVADLRGSDCYDAIAAYAAAHPDIQIIYDVAIGDSRVDAGIKDLVLPSGSYSLSDLIAGLPHLRDITSLSLPATSLSAQELVMLEAGFPQIALAYTVQIQDREIPRDTSSLDLSHLLPEQVADACEALAKLPCLKDVELMTPEGTSALGIHDVRMLMDALPDAAFHYTFELFGTTISTADERIEFINTYIGNEGVAQIRDALSILPNCNYLLMDTCGVDNEIMAQLREDYAQTTKVVWRVWLVEEDYSSRLYLRCGSYLTDTHRIRTTHVNDENSHVLNFCNETKYVDVGHVWQLTQCEFLAYMPDLEVCIIAITEITDITPLANHEKLEYLELFTTDIADISPLLTCPNIEHLNLSNMPKLDDISPVFSLKKLKRLRMVDSPLISDAEVQQAAEALPDCNILNMGHFATAWGWRYLDPNKENMDPRYALLCEQMEYDIDAYEYGIP